MKVGQRVQIKGGVLCGEKATVTCNPESGEHVYRDRYIHEDMVWIRFDREGARVKAGPVYDVLSQRWLYVSELKMI